MQSKRVNFAFTYIGPELHPDILEAIDAKTCETYVDSHGFSYAFICTHVPKRTQLIESVINESEQYRFYPFVGEPDVVTFSKQPGQMATDHYIVKTIKKYKADNAPTYKSWTSTVQRPYKKRRVVIDVSDDEAPIVVQASIAPDLDAAILAAKDALIEHLQSALDLSNAKIARLTSTIDDMVDASRMALTTMLAGRRSLQ
jgi:hypothetical protein